MIAFKSFDWLFICKRTVVTCACTKNTTIVTHQFSCHILAAVKTFNREREREREILMGAGVD